MNTIQKAAIAVIIVGFVMSAVGMLFMDSSMVAWTGFVLLLGGIITHIKADE